LNATAIPGISKYLGLLVEKNSFRVVKNSQKNWVLGLEKLEHLTLVTYATPVILNKTNRDKVLIVTWCVQFVPSHYADIFMFPMQRFGKIC